MKMNAKLNRSLHRDIAYFYLGLIISFSISGIALNHRRVWSPMNYTYESREVAAVLPEDKTLLTDELIREVVVDQIGLSNEVRGFRVERGLVRVFITDGLIELSESDGKGKVELYRKRPVLGQMTLLHVTTDNWWIYYSDGFGLGMLIIAITGMFISKRETSFTARGWKLALAGILFPLFFLFFLG